MRTRSASARCLLAGGLLLIATAVSAQPGANAGPAKAKATAPEIPFDSVANFFKLPAGLYMGEGIGVATNSKGHVFVFVRSGESRLFEFDQNGAFVKEFGAGSYGFSFAHAVRVDKDDNVWAVDEGTNVIQKFNPDGKLLMVLGKRPDPLDQLALMPGGGQSRREPALYVPSANRHRLGPAGQHLRVRRLRRLARREVRQERPLRQGRRHARERCAQFSTPHAISVDAKGLVYVADRGNRRIVVLDNDLNQKAVYEHVGAPWAVCISAGPHQYLYSSNSFPTGNNFDQAADTGEIYKMELDGTVIGRFGKPGTASRNSAAFTRWTAAIPTRSTCRRSPSGGAEVILRPQAAGHRQANRSRS